MFMECGWTHYFKLFPNVNNYHFYYLNKNIKSTNFNKSYCNRCQLQCTPYSKIVPCLSGWVRTKLPGGNYLKTLQEIKFWRLKRFFTSPQSMILRSFRNDYIHSIWLLWLSTQVERKASPEQWTLITEYWTINT